MKYTEKLASQYEEYIRFYSKAIYSAAYEYLGRIYHYYKFYEKRLPDNILSSFCIPISEEMIKDIHKSIKIDYE